MLRVRNGTGITQHSRRALRQVSKVERAGLAHILTASHSGVPITATVLLRLSSGVMVILRTLQIPETDHYETSWYNELTGFESPN